MKEKKIDQTNTIKLNLKSNFTYDSRLNKKL